MNVFLDTSSLFKLYQYEKDTPLVEAVFHDNEVETVFLSEITKLEFASSVWKKHRMKELSVTQANALVKAFEKDEHKYFFQLTDTAMLHQALALFVNHGQQGLRTLDSIQLATALSLQPQVQKFICSDKLLHSFLKVEGLPTW